MIDNIKIMKLELLKTFIEKNRVNCFIKSFESPTIALISFLKKLHKSIWFVINHSILNILTIQN